MFSESSPCLLGQHGSSSTAQWPVELSENILQNLRNKLPPKTVFNCRLSKVIVFSIFADDILAVPESNLGKMEAFLKELEEKGKERELEDSIEEDEAEFNRKKQEQGSVQ